MLRGWMVEAHGIAHHVGWRATTAVPEDLVLFADLLARKIKELCHGDVGCAEATMSLALRHECEHSWFEQARSRLLIIEPATPASDDVEQVLFVRME